MGGGSSARWSCIRQPPDVLHNASSPICCSPCDFNAGVHPSLTGGLSGSLRYTLRFEVLVLWKKWSNGHPPRPTHTAGNHVTLSLAVDYVVAGQSHWDNNDGANYTFDLPCE